MQVTFPAWGKHTQGCVYLWVRDGLYASGCLQWNGLESPSAPDLWCHSSSSVCFFPGWGLGSPNSFLRFI